MRVETLPSPGLVSNGFRVRVEAAKAISAVEIAAARTPSGKSTTATTLRAFFTACAAALDSLYDSTAPTMAGISPATAASATQINLTFAEVMDQSVVPAASAFAVNNGGTVATVAWVSSTVLRLTGTGYAGGDTVTYTQPAVNALRDGAGNLVASGTKVVA